MYILNKALEYIFLPCCGVCNKLGEGYLCRRCEKELEKYIVNLKHILENAEAFHVFKYEKLIRKMIIGYKFNDKSYLYKTFCEIIVKNKKTLEFIKSYDIIIPVPIHKKRKKERGYNQSELIVQELSRRIGIKYYKNILVKTINNKPQSTLSKEMRKENTENVYKLAEKEKINNKKVLLFDDIYTTGATANSCIKELKKAKTKKIGLLTLAID